MLATDSILANGSNAASADNDALVQPTNFEGMAGCIARNASDLPVNSRQLLARHFGTGTEVTLPNGAMLDTVSLSGARRSMHSNNNRLGVASAGGYLPGMHNNQQPDFSTATQGFMQAAMQPSIADAFLGPVFAGATALGATALGVTALGGATALYGFNWIINRII